MAAMEQGHKATKPPNFKNPSLKDQGAYGSVGCAGHLNIVVLGPPKAQFERHVPQRIRFENGALALRVLNI